MVFSWPSVSVVIPHFNSTDTIGRALESIAVQTLLPLEVVVVDEDFVLLVPTYGGGNGRGAVPKQVIKFLNDERNRRHIRGVISAGNTNFGEAYCLAGDIISAKCQVPHMYKFELFGTPRDVTRVHDGLEEFWRH